MFKPIAGIINGRTIELAEDPGMQAGQPVDVVLQPSLPAHIWGDGIRQSAGAWAPFPELDQVLQSIHDERKLERGVGSES